MNIDHNPLANIEEDTTFTLHKVKAGTHLDLFLDKENLIIFVLKGKIKISGVGSKDVTLTSLKMYNTSKNLKPSSCIALESTIFIKLKTDALLPFTDIQYLRDIRKLREFESKELIGLPINLLLKTFLVGIIFLKRNDFSSRVVYDLKKQELLMILRKNFERPILAQFFMAAITAESEFKILVISHYTNSINVKNLAEKCFMTTKTFTNHFQDEFQTTPHKWLTETKINNLTNDILNKSYPIALILSEYGFASKSDLRKFCVRNNLNEITKILDSKINY